MTKRIEDYFDAEALTHDELFVEKMGMVPFYDEIEKTLNGCVKRDSVLVLGCGSGLEVERIHFPCHVVGVDISSKMVEVLSRKTLFDGVQLTTVCASFLEWDFGIRCYDVVLSCYAMHHFNEEQKQRIYRKIHSCLTPGGVFINGDTMAQNLQAEEAAMKEALAVYSSQDMPFASLHVDVPFCWEHERQLLQQAGFEKIELLKAWTHTKLYRCTK